MKRPSFQFYPGDWRKDQNLSRASLEAKGALIEVLCLAFECEKRGVLKTGKTAWTIEEIAHAMGGDKMRNISAIEELLTLKVLKKDRKNAIFSSRMVRDEKLSKVRRACGSRGGNPNLVNQKFNQKTTPAASSSASTSVIKQASMYDEVFEIMRRSTGKEFSDRLLKTEAKSLINKYGQNIRNPAGLVKDWMLYVKPDEKQVTANDFV